MKNKYIAMMVAAAGLLSTTSCLHTTVSDDHFAYSDADSERLASDFVTKFAYDNGSNHSNGIRVYNNTGYDCQLDYITGKTMIGSGAENYVDVVVPFAGHLTFTATVLADGALVNVPIDVQVDDIDKDLDPLFKCLTNGTAEGKVWQWWADEQPDGSYAYIDGSWGCVGGGGYGWSATGPNWVCYGIGQEDEWTGLLVSMEEWVKFDCDGGPNMTVHYSDGTEAKGTFALTSSTTPEKAAVGWVGTIKLTALLPHQVSGDQYSWYLEEAPAAFDVAMLDDDHLILIAPGSSATIFCDPGWGGASTHWTFKAK